MEKSKISPELEIALAADNYVIQKDSELSLGYYEQLKKWTLIIKYTGELAGLARDYDITAEDMRAGFAIIVIEKVKVELFSKDTRVIYVDKPKSFYYENLYVGKSTKNNSTNNISRSMVHSYKNRKVKINSTVQKQMQVEDVYNTSQKVMVGIIDSGADIYNKNFYVESFDGTKHTKIYEFWDQQNDKVYTTKMLDELLNGDDYINFDNSGHGTAVADIILNNSEHILPVIVRLNCIINEGEPDTASIIKGIAYLANTALRLDLPLVINLSYGNNYGNHNGESMIEEYIDSLSLLQRINVITGMGNDGIAGRHSQIMLGEISRGTTEFSVGEYQPGFSIQIWRRIIDEVEVIVTTPDNVEAGPVARLKVVDEYNFPNFFLYCVESVSPFSQYIETFLSFIPKNDYIPDGIWKISLIPKSIQDGRIDLWLPASEKVGPSTRFLKASNNTTMTIPASSGSVISVGAYNPLTLTYASFSGRGYTVSNNVKPDISAPGVNIPVTLPQNVRSYVSGTSFAAPFVTAEASRLMYNGIVLGKDRYMYGQRLKAKLIEDSCKLPGYNRWPNEELGWGVLCINR